MRERATTHLAADPAAAGPPIPDPGRRGSPPDPDGGRAAPDAAAIEADRLLVDIDRLLVSERQVGALWALARVLRVLRHATPAGLVEIVATLEELRLGADHVEEVLRRLDALADRARHGDGGVADRPAVCKRRHLPPDGDGGKPRSGDDRGEPLPAGVAPRRHGASPALMPPGNPQPSPPHADARGHRSLQATPEKAVGGKAEQSSGGIGSPRCGERLDSSLAAYQPDHTAARSIDGHGFIDPAGDPEDHRAHQEPDRMTTSTSARELEVWAQARRLRVALIAPPAAAVPPSGLGGLDQVRWLAEGLAARGHQVTLIGADLGTLGGGGYQVVDTDPAGGHRARPEEAERWHAEQAGKALEYLAGGEVEVVSDHTRTGWLPASGASLDLPTVQTRYQPPDEDRGLVCRPGHLGWVAVSVYQRHHWRRRPTSGGPGWVGVIHPAIPVGEHLLGMGHTGLCLYLGPLTERDGAGVALEAAHQAGWPITLAGTHPSPMATVYAEVALRPRLGDGDELLEAVSPLERWELLARASCLVAPLSPQVAFSLEAVEAMAYGTPVVTMVDTVGAELVSHGLSGLVVDDEAALPAAILRSVRLSPRRTRDWAASRYDLVGMVSAYEWLLTKLLATDRSGGDADPASPSHGSAAMGMADRTEPTGG
jgi:hypothetical protein